MAGEPRPPVEDAPRASAVAIVIPCFNVEQHIAGVIHAIPARYGHIICVDDCSTDGTAPAIEALGDERVTLIRRERNGGVGAATKTGYREALRRDVAVCVKMDGDGQMSPEDLPALVAPLLAGEADYSKGNRFVDRQALRAMPRHRLLGNALLLFVSKAACGYWNMLDVTNGYTAITTAMLRRLVFSLLDERYFFETSMLIELNILRARVIDVEMKARYGDEMSSLRIRTVALSFPWLLVRGVQRRFYWRYLIHDFGVVSVCALLGLPLVLFGVVFGAREWIRSAQTGVVASAGTVLLAALPILLGVQLLLVALVLDVVSSDTAKSRARK